MWLLGDKFNELELSVRVDLSLVHISLCIGHDTSHLHTWSPFDSFHLAFPSHTNPVGPPVMDKWRLVLGLVRKSVCLYCQRDGGLRALLLTDSS